MTLSRRHHSIFIQVVWSVLVAGDGWKVTMPSQVSGLTGSCVVIPCSFTHPSYHTPRDAVWYLYSSVPSRYPLVYSSVDPQAVEGNFRNQTRLLGSVPSGNCTLQIGRLLSEHNGEAIYPWIDGVNFKFYQKVVTLRISGTATKPKMSVSGEQAEEGGAISVSCEVIHSCPSYPPTISFGKEDVEVQMNHTYEAEGHWRLLSTITFIAKAEEHGKTVECKVTHPGGQTATEEVVLRVSYSPRSVVISGDKTVFPVGTDVTLTCVSDANPPASSFLWYTLKEGLLSALSQSTETITLTDLDPDENRFHCTAANTLGQANSSAAFVVIAEYEPSILAASSCLYYRGRMECRCAVKARPLAAVHWRVDGRHQSSTSPANISLQHHMVEETWSTLVATDNMSVTCMVNNTHGQKELLLPVFTRAAPTNVSISQSPVHPVVGETVTLTCLAEASPPVSSYTWYRMHGQVAVPLRGASQSLNLTEVSRDVGSFYCRTVNEMGEASSPTTAVNVEYVPVILPASSCFVADEVIRCECVADSHPVGSVTWSPRSTQDNNQTRNITTTLPHRRVFTLVLIGLKSDVFCNVTNEHGTASLKLPLRGDSSGRSAIYAGVGCVLVLAFVIGLLSFLKFYSAKRSRRRVDYSVDEVELRGSLQATHKSTHHAGTPEAKVRWI